MRSGQEPTVIQISRFKARCLALLDEVARTGATLVVTKRGKPIAKVVPFDAPVGRPLNGSVTFLVDDDEALFSTGEAWEADAG
jgi:prevent-host-death family protein